MTRSDARKRLVPPTGPHAPAAGDEGGGLSEDALALILSAALHAAIDGDFLVGAGMRHGNVGEDVAICDATVKEIVWWAAHAGTAALVAARRPADEGGLREGLGRSLERLLEEHWPNSGVNPWYLADLLREEGYQPEANEGCDCTELCEMGPTCPGGMLAGLPDAGCWRTTPEGEAMREELRKAVEHAAGTPSWTKRRMPALDHDRLTEGNPGSHEGQGER